MIYLLFVMSKAQECLYKVLKVSRSSSDKEIRDSFIRLAKIYHPDVNQCDTAPAMFRQVHEAYTSLKDAKARSAYELSLLKKVHHYSPSHYHANSTGTLTAYCSLTSVK